MSKPTGFCIHNVSLAENCKFCDDMARAPVPIPKNDDFDEEAAEAAGFEIISKNLIGKSDTFKSGAWNGFVEGARWMFDRMKNK